MHKNRTYLAKDEFRWTPFNELEQRFEVIRHHEEEGYDTVGIHTEWKIVKVNNKPVVNPELIEKIVKNTYMGFAEKLITDYHYPDCACQCGPTECDCNFYKDAKSLGFPIDKWQEDAKKQREEIAARLQEHWNSPEGQATINDLHEKFKQIKTNSK